jgi:hypothetical protein
LRARVSALVCGIWPGVVPERLDAVGSHLLGKMGGENGCFLLEREAAHKGGWRPGQRRRPGESGPESWDASGSDRWCGRLNSPVADVQTFWERFTIGPGHVGNVRVSDPYETDIPVALRVVFAAGPVWMVAGILQDPEMREVFVPGDEVMVVFTAERMRQIGCPDSEFLAPGRD